MCCHKATLEAQLARELAHAAQAARGQALSFSYTLSPAPMTGHKQTCTHVGAWQPESHVALLKHDAHAAPSKAPSGLTSSASTSRGRPASSGPSRDPKSSGTATPQRGPTSGTPPARSAQVGALRPLWPQPDS